MFPAQRRRRASHYGRWLGPFRPRIDRHQSLASNGLHRSGRHRVCALTRRTGQPPILNRRGLCSPEPPGPSCPFCCSVKSKSENNYLERRSQPYNVFLTLQSSKSLPAAQLHTAIDPRLRPGIPRRKTGRQRRKRQQSECHHPPSARFCATVDCRQ